MIFNNKKKKKQQQPDISWQDFKTNKALIKQVIESCITDENLTVEMITLDGTRLIFRYNDKSIANPRPTFTGEEWARN